MRTYLVRPRIVPLVAIVGLILAGWVGFNISNPNSAEGLTNCSVADLSISSEEQAFLGLINQYRAQNGRPALAYSTNLTRMATWHATDMATKNYFSHADSLGRSFGTRLQQCDSSGGAAAENIAAGQATAQAVFNSWRGSSGHNATMLNASYRYIGISLVQGGSYGHYWVTDFSSINPGGGTPSTATAVSNTATRTPTTLPVATNTPTASVSKAVLTSPRQGKTIQSSTVTFAWSAAQGADRYGISVGTSPGAGNIHYSNWIGLNQSRTVNNIPADQVIYVRVWTGKGTLVYYSDYTFRTR